MPLPEEMRALEEAVILDRLLPSRVLCHCHWQPEPRDAATVILVHGLEGSSHSHYVVGNADKLWHAGCNVVRMNMRNCGGTDALSPTLYHSGLSSDVLAVLDWCIARDLRSVLLAGYSMGGNLVLKAAGELDNHAPDGDAATPGGPGRGSPVLRGVVAVSPPIDLAECADALHLLPNRIYERRFLRNLTARYRRKVQLFPAVFNPAPLARVRSIRDFDQLVMAPHCGFTGAADYYARSGASRVIGRIRVPTLLIHALDDPFIRLTPRTRIKLRDNPHVELLEPEHGGHCAFLEDADPATGYDGYWAEQRLLAFVQKHASASAVWMEPVRASC